MFVFADPINLGTQSLQIVKKCRVAFGHTFGLFDFDGNTGAPKNGPSHGDSVIPMRVDARGLQTFGLCGVYGHCVGFGVQINPNACFGKLRLQHHGSVRFFVAQAADPPQHRRFFAEGSQGSQGGEEVWALGQIHHKPSHRPLRYFDPGIGP